MKNANVFNKYFKFDPTSNTGFVYRKSGKEAGHTPPRRNHLALNLNCKEGAYKWSLARVLFEIYHGYEPPKEFNVCFFDGDNTNILKSNLCLVPKGRKKGSKNNGRK